MMAEGGARRLSLATAEVEAPRRPCRHPYDSAQRADDTGKGNTYAAMAAANFLEPGIEKHQRSILPSSSQGAERSPTPRPWPRPQGYLCGRGATLASATNRASLRRGADRATPRAGATTCGSQGTPGSKPGRRLWESRKIVINLEDCATALWWPMHSKGCAPNRCATANQQKAPTLASQSALHRCPHFAGNQSVRTPPGADPRREAWNAYTQGHGSTYRDRTTSPVPMEKQLRASQHRARRAPSPRPNGTKPHGRWNPLGGTEPPGVRKPSP